MTRNECCPWGTMLDTIDPARLHGEEGIRPSQPEERLWAEEIACRCATENAPAPNDFLGCSRACLPRVRRTSLPMRSGR